MTYRLRLVTSRAMCGVRLVRKRYGASELSLAVMGTRVDQIRVAIRRPHQLRRVKPIAQQQSLVVGCPAIYPHIGTFPSPLFRNYPDVVSVTSTTAFCRIFREYGLPILQVARQERSERKVNKIRTHTMTAENLKMDGTKAQS